MNVEMINSYLGTELSKEEILNTLVDAEFLKGHITQARDLCVFHDSLFDSVPKEYVSEATRNLHELGEVAQSGFRKTLIGNDLQYNLYVYSQLLNGYSFKHLAKQVRYVLGRAGNSNTERIQESVQYHADKEIKQTRLWEHELHSTMLSDEGKSMIDEAKKSLKDGLFPMAIKVDDQEFQVEMHHTIIYALIINLMNEARKENNLMSDKDFELIKRKLAGKTLAPLERVNPDDETLQAFRKEVWDYLKFSRRNLMNIVKTRDVEGYKTTEQAYVRQLLTAMSYGETWLITNLAFCLRDLRTKFSQTLIV